MSRSSSHSANHATNTRNSEVELTQETLFLLSISRDEDDAAALRADLKRSTLGNYKIQHCANLDDALQLMRVCGFDLVFVRLDDYKDKQTAINLIKKCEIEQTIIALATSRLLASPNFSLPHGIDATCRVEDLSPSLISTLVQTTIERKKEQKGRERLERELRLALDASQLGLWKLEIDSGRLILDPLAQRLMGIEQNVGVFYLDDALDHVFFEDHGLLKHQIAESIENTRSIKVTVRLQGDSMPLQKIELNGQYSPGGPREKAHLYGVLKRHDQTLEIYERIANANSAIQKAIDLRDEAMRAANDELKALASELGGPEIPQTIQPFEEIPAPASQAQSPSKQIDLQNAKSNQSKEQQPPPSPPQGSVVSDAPKAVAATDREPTPGENLEKLVGKKSHLPPPPVAPIEYDEPIDELQIQVPEPESEPNPEDNTLEIDTQAAFQNVLQSISRHHEEEKQIQETFPFDFSTEADADYTDPDPHSEGFIGAAKRLISITQKAHNLFVTLSLDDYAAIEAEQEKDLLFEILKELLTNVVKHARASECIIALFRDEDEWVMQVEDDGVGLENNLVSISSPLKQMGLFRIRTKLALKGGQLDLTPSFPTGLIARARLPVKSMRKQSR